MGDEQEAPFAYFAGTPPTFQAGPDMVVRVRGGAELPAHSQLLTSISPVLSDFLQAGGSHVAAGSKTGLPAR